MNEIRIEVGRLHDERPEVTYVVQVIKFHDRRFDSGSVIKEIILDRGKTFISFDVGNNKGGKS